MDLSGLSRIRCRHGDGTQAAQLVPWSRALRPALGSRSIYRRRNGLGRLRSLGRARDECSALSGNARDCDNKRGSTGDTSRAIARRYCQPRRRCHVANGGSIVGPKEIALPLLRPMVRLNGGNWLCGAEIVRRKVRFPPGNGRSMLPRNRRSQPIGEVPIRMPIGCSRRNWDAHCWRKPSLEERRLAPITPSAWIISLEDAANGRAD